MIRSIIYKGLLKFFEEGHYFRNFLKNHTLENRDYAFALEIGQGVIKHYKTLEVMSKALHKEGKLKLKKKEKILLYLSLYQCFFLSKVPRYAIVDEAVTIAKQHGMHYFSKFLNAYLKALPEHFSLPTPKTFDDLVAYYSYPADYIKILLDTFPKETVIKILERGNQKPQTFARLRYGESSLPSLDTSFCKIENVDAIKICSDNPQYYIQNPSSYYLVKEALPYLKTPKTVLDLCAAPGGKALALHDLMKGSFELTLNEPSEARLNTLRENIEKYQLKSSITSYLGEDYPLDKTFDLILIDTPCSNSGTLSRKPEARWRLEKKEIQGLVDLQRKLIAHASQLLSPQGQILYLTCSILPEENEEQVEVATTELSLIKKSPGFSITPSDSGLDGGFCAVLEKLT